MNGSFIEWHFGQTGLRDRTELTVGRRGGGGIGVTSVQQRTQVYSIPLAFSTNTCIQNDPKITLKTQTDTDMSSSQSVGKQKKKD